MGVKVEDFLYDYFSVEQLKEALYDIGIPAGKTKKECVDKILEKWTAYNRGWYDLLNFLDTEDLENICEHFKIEYTDWDNEESLMDKIEENWVLDFRNKQKKRVSKNTNKPSVRIDNQNIHIGDNKINSENITKINSDNVIKINSDNSFYSNLSDNKKRMFILGVVSIIVMVGIAVYQGYESAMDNWNNSESSNEITTEVTGDKNTVVVGDNNLVMSFEGKYVELDPVLATFIQEFVQKTISEQQQAINDLQEKLSTTTDKNERYELERIIDKLQLADYALDNENFIEAEKQYHLILDINEKNTDALEGLGLSLARQEKYDESIFYYNQLLGIEPDNYEALINNAWSYSLLKEYDESISLLNDLENKDPDDMVVLSHKCWVLHKLDLHSDAIDTCKKVISSGTYDDRVSKAYSLSLSLLNRSDEALPFHEKLYRTYPNDFATLMNYANALSDVGQIQESLKIYNEGLEKFPNQKYLEQNKKVLCANNPQLQCE